LEEARKRPPALDRPYTDEEMWGNYEYFMKRVLPVAEDAGVRLQLHPNDLPATHQGVARIFRSRRAFRRALEISRHSPYSGLLAQRDGLQPGESVAAGTAGEDRQLVADESTAAAGEDPGTGWSTCAIRTGCYWPRAN